MPYVIFREDGLVVALDEVGPRLIITQYNDALNEDCLLALVPLPPSGLEVLNWGQGKDSQPEHPAGEVAEWARRSTSSRGGAMSPPGWRRSA